jgi:tRNA threonylcarbamoyladenosine biosynthesis protein TsaE
MLDLKIFKSKFNKLLDNEEHTDSLQIELHLNDLPKFAEIVVSFLTPGDWLFLDGDLGSGKTAFTKELSISLGADEFSVSPTFSILNIEKLNLNKGIKSKSTNINTLVHLDLYRLKSGKELIYLGLENEFNPNSTICVFEWPYNVDEDDFAYFFKVTKCARPKRIIEIRIEPNSNGEKRIYTFNKIFL